MGVVCVHGGNVYRRRRKWGGRRRTTVEKTRRYASSCTRRKKNKKKRRRACCNDAHVCGTTCDGNRRDVEWSTWRGCPRGRNSGGERESGKYDMYSRGCVCGCTHPTGYYEYESSAGPGAECGTHALLRAEWRRGRARRLWYRIHALLERHTGTVVDWTWCWRHGHDRLGYGGCG